MLLFIRPKTGVAATLAIIVTDVVHNLWFTATYQRTTSLLRATAASPFLVSQIGFLVFVVLTFSIAWPHAPDKVQEASG